MARFILYFFTYICIFETGTPYVVLATLVLSYVDQTGFEFIEIPLSLPPECRD